MNQSLATLAAALLSFPPPGGTQATDNAPNHTREWFKAAYTQLLDAASGTKSERPECVDMLDAVLSGSAMGPGDGWFKPSRLRYDWDWLAARFDAKDKKITREQFTGPAEWFDRLDRDGDGEITPDDFDWSPKSPYVRQLGQVGPWFARTDLNSNGRISRREWEEMFNKAARGKDHLTIEDVRAMMFPPQPPMTEEMKKKMTPTKETLISGLLQGELGSPFTGPRPGKKAPLFTLPLHDGIGSVSLADHIGEKPVVLIFGSFT